MYGLTEEQLNTLNYILNHLTVTGPDQGGLLNNAARILRAAERIEKRKEVKEDNGSENSTSHN